MGYEDRTKIKAMEYEVYIAKRTVVRTPVTLPTRAVIDAGGDATWKAVGAYQQKGAKFKTEDVTTILQGGNNHQLGVKGTFEVPALETDSTKLTTLETFLPERVDILCVEINGTYTYVEYLNMGLIVNAEDALNQEEPNKFPLKASAFAAKVSDIRAQGTIAA